MKFLCPQCKAKYQIADEKIDGRTLRMKCRRCEFEITVRGDGSMGQVGGPASEPPAPHAAAAKPGSSAGRLASPNIGQTSRTGSSVGPAPQRAKASVRPSIRAPGPTSAIGADFRRQGVTAPQDTGSHGTASALDQWHVSIQDVPVGPMKREELARKIATGAVTGESLCWREGYDDWRPLKDIAELSPLLRRSAPPPAAARPGAPAARPGQRPSGPAPRVPAARTPSSAGTRPAPVDSRAAARSNVVPIGGRLGASAAPAMDDLEQFDESSEPTRVAANPFDESGAAAAARAAASSLDAPIIDQGSFPPIVGASLPPSGAPAAPASGGNDLLFASIPPAAPIPRAAPVPRGAGAAPVAAAVPASSPSSVSIPPVQYVDRRRSAGIPVGGWIAIVLAGCFGITLAALVASKLLADKPTPVVIAQAPADTAARLPEATVDLNLQAPTPSTPTNVATPTSPTTPTTPDRNGGGPARRPNTGGTAPAAEQPAAAGGRQLTAAEQAEFDRMSGGNTTFRPVAGNRADDAPQQGGAEMTAEQLRSVINRERGSAQHCYEMAARQTGSQDTMRVNVHFEASATGRVTSAAATGGPDVLNRCIEGAVRRWHFPGAGEATMPFVFQPGG